MSLLALHLFLQSYLGEERLNKVYMSVAENKNASHLKKLNSKAVPAQAASIALLPRRWRQEPGGIGGLAQEGRT